VDGLETHFNRELHAWNNRTGEAEFGVVFRAIRPLCMSLPMLLLQLEKIIDILLANLNPQSITVTDAVLRYLSPRLLLPNINILFSLIGILARDMRSQFYEHFPRVITALVAKLDEWRASPELLEKLFETLSYLFKYLQSQLTADINKVIMCASRSLPFPSHWSDWLTYSLAWSGIISISLNIPSHTSDNSLQRASHF